jgi:hypothetical protein
MWDWKRKLVVIAVPAVLAIGGTAVIAHAAGPVGGSPTTLLAATSPSPAAAAPESATEAPETAAEKAAEAAEPNEPSLPGGGHADPAGQADHQFEGVE